MQSGSAPMTLSRSGSRWTAPCPTSRTPTTSTSRSGKLGWLGWLVRVDGLPHPFVVTYCNVCGRAAAYKLPCLPPPPSTPLSPDPNPALPALSSYSGGPRKCVGDQFALMEAVVSLAVLLKEYNLKPKPGHDPGMTTGATIHTKNGLYVHVSKRHGGSSTSGAQPAAAAAVGVA